MKKLQVPLVLAYMQKKKQLEEMCNFTEVHLFELRERESERKRKESKKRIQIETETKP